MELRNFHVAYAPPIAVRISWSIIGLAAGDEIHVERAESPEGPWKNVETVSYDTVSVDDRGVIGSSMWRTFWWRIRVTRPPSGDDLLRAVAQTLGTRVNRHMAAIIRKHNLMLYGRSGQGVGPGHWLACYKTPIDSRPCPYCVDPVTKEIILGNCNVCEGTRRVDRWPQPILFRARFEGSVHVGTKQGVHEHDDDNRQLRCSNFPILEQGDLLAERDANVVWQVGTIERSAPGNIILSQVALITRVPAHSIHATLSYPDTPLPPGPHQILR